MPTPKSKPSRATKTASITVTATYQKSPWRERLLLYQSSAHRSGVAEPGRLEPGRVVMVSSEQEEKQESQQQVHPEESKQGEQGIAGMHERGNALGGPQQAIDEPGCRPSSAVIHPAVVAI